MALGRAGQSPLVRVLASRGAGRGGDYSREIEGSASVIGFFRTSRSRS